MHRGAPHSRSGSHGTERIARLWSLPARSTTARAVQALRDSTARPICNGGLAHYFVQEAQRRAHLEESPPLAPASAIAALAALPASHQMCGELEESCPVCLQKDAAGDRNETITLLCGHKFHKTCESSSKVCADAAERLGERDKFGRGRDTFHRDFTDARRGVPVAGIVSWLGVKSSCPCCRVPVSGLELYRYPARTQLRSAFLRERLDRRLDWRDPALQSSHWDGMTDFVQACINAPATPLASVLQVQISGPRPSSPGPPAVAILHPDHGGGAAGTTATSDRSLTRREKEPIDSDDAFNAGRNFPVDILSRMCSASRPSPPGEDDMLIDQDYSAHSFSAPTQDCDMEIVSADNSGSAIPTAPSGSSSVGAQVDEVTKLVLESAEAEPELRVGPVDFARRDLQAQRE